MRALVFTEPGRVELRTEPEPVPADDEALVEVRASSICGSELHGFRAAGFRVPPLVMGHEFAGTTSDGARVVVNPLITCGECAACRAGDPQVCSTRQLLGVHRAGGFAERVVVPRGNVHTIPDGLDWATASLVEPLANGVHAWTLVPQVPSRAAVVGAGPIGLVTALVARHHGAEVVVVDTVATRRATAERLGFETRPQLDDGEVFPVVVDAVGLGATRAASLSHLDRAGTALWLGLAEDATEVSGNDVVRSEKRVAGSFAYRPAEFAEALTLASDLDLSWATPVPFAEAEETFMALAEGRSDLVKAVLMTDDATPGGAA